MKGRDREKRLLLVKAYAEALADWHNSRSQASRKAADEALEEIIDRGGHRLGLGVRVVRGPEGWVVDAGELEIRSKSPQEAVLFLKGLLEGEGKSLVPLLRGYGGWEKVKVDGDGDIAVKAPGGGKLWLGEARVADFLLWVARRRPDLVFLQTWKKERET